VTLSDLETEALKLPAEERARLAEMLLRSLEALSDEENTRLWMEEARRRDAELDADPSRGRPAEDVFRDARARLAAAIKGYELRRVSQGRAAEIAGVSRAKFIDALGRYGVSPFQETLDELADQLGAQRQEEQHTVASK